MRKSLLLLLVLFVIPVGAVASSGESSVRLGIEAVGTEGPYFEVTLEPSESAELTVRFSNHGEAGTGASVYAADVYTLPGGGMGIRQMDEPKSGPTEWLAFDSGELELQAGEAVEQSFTATVPEGTEPGDYITALVIQNTDPVAVGDENQQFNQTVRQGIAVDIDVPGPREPELEIGEAEHTAAGDRSVIQIDIANQGNAHLRPEGELTLHAGNGDVVSEHPVTMDTIYAGMETVLEIPLESRLGPGDYAVSLQLADAETGTEVSADEIPLRVPTSGVAETADGDEDTMPDGAVATEDESDSSPGPIGWIVTVLAILTILALVPVLAMFLLRRQARSRGPAGGEPSVAPRQPAENTEPSRPASTRTIRQLAPRKRSG